MSFRSKARPAKLCELSSQGTEISPQNWKIEVQRPRLATNDKKHIFKLLIFSGSSFGIISWKNRCGCQ